MTGVLQTLLGGFGAAAAAVTDAYFYLVTLLLPGNGTNGAQNNTFLDSSTNNFTITRNGNTTQGTFSPFSQTGWSVFLDSSGDYFTSTATTLGGTSVSTFTIDGWIFPNTFANAIYIIGDMEPTGGSNFLSVNITTSGAITLTWFDGASKTCTSTGTLTLNQWNYFAVRVSSNAITIYANSATAGQTGTTTLTNRTGTSNFAVGAFNNSATPNAYLSNVRVSTVARTISIPTSAFSNDADTRFLLFQSNSFINNGSTSVTLTPFGNTSIQAFSPFAPTAAYSAATVGGSGYFDGSGDYLTAPSTSGQLGAGDFTIECWSYLNARVTSFPCIWGNYSSFGAGGLALFAGHNAGTTTKYNVALNGTFPAIQSTDSIIYNQWTHLALVRSGTTVTLYVNGVANGTTTSSATLNGTSGICYIGSAGDDVANGYIQGYLSNLRVVVGTAVYTSAFTPPTAPLTAITNTKLLLNTTNAGITDATAKNDLETVGNAQISTTQSKFGGSSMYFDGTGDYALTISSVANSALGSGDWTVEFWLYTNVGSTTYNVIDWRPNATQGAYFSFYLNSGTPTYYTSSADRIVGGSAIPATTWTHVAVSRSGTSTKMFINGTQSGSTYTDTANYLGTVNRPAIGGGGSDTNNTLNGYIDDLRVTRGYARYTANFTAPTSAFPLQ